MQQNKTSPGSMRVEPANYRCGEIHIEVANRRFTREGVELPLEPKVFAVILQLVARPGVLVSRHELLDAVWGHRYVTSSTLNRLIVLARRAFGDDSDEPKFVQTVHGAGYRYIGPIVPAEQIPGGSPVRFAPPETARLPVRIEPLIGREHELAVLSELIRSHRAVTVLGTGGIGKTQSALESARTMAAEFPDGIWFFDLAPMQYGAEWLKALADALAIPGAGTDEMINKIVELLQGRRALLLIDNCDHLAADIGVLVFAILHRTDTLKILATSQAPLNFMGEQLMRMPPLALPETNAGVEFSLDEIAAAPAVQMLLVRVRSIQPAFALTASNAAVVVEICRRLDGMPLALELAAARFSLLSPEQVLARLDHRFRFLSSDVAGRDPRHHNLLSLLDWSFTLLSPEERRLLLWCSVFVQGWTVEEAVRFAGPLALDPEIIVDLLTGLVKKSLVSAAPNLSPPHFQLLETVREYALGHLIATGEEPGARAAHLGAIVELCQAAYGDMVGGRMRQGIEHLIHEHGNIAAALEFCDRYRNHAAAMGIVGALPLYLKVRGLYRLGRDWCQRALDGGEKPESLERGRALLSLGVATFHGAAGMEAAGDALPDAARIARQHRDYWTEAYADGFHALWLANWGRAEQAEARVANTARIGEQLNDPILLGLAGLARGWVHIAQGNYTAAIAELGAVRDLGHDLHQRHFIDMYIGLSRFALGELALAARQWLEAMRRAAEVGNIRGVAGSIEGCGYIAERGGRFPEAVRLLAAARQIRERTECPLFNFWLPHHDAAEAALRLKLDPVQYGAASVAGRQVRPELAADEARILLESFSLDPSASAA